MNDLIEQLRAAKTDEDREWLVMRFSLDSLEPAVRDAVWAASIPRWFDRSSLAALLNKEVNDEFLQIFDKLLACSFVETFPGKGHNIHERSRALLVNRLSKEQPEYYRKLNSRAANYYDRKDENDPSWQVARVYHGLLSGEQAAVNQLTVLGQLWLHQHQYDRVESLARPVIVESSMGRVSPHAAAWAYYFQGRSDLRYSRFESAKVGFSSALRSYSKDRQLQAHNLEALGEAQLQLGQLSDAEEKVGQARRIYEDIGDKISEANSTFLLGRILWYRNDNEGALNKYEEALPLFKEAGAQLGEANCKAVLGEAYMFLEQYDKARLNIVEALPIFQTTGSAQNVANCLKLLGDLAVELGQYDEARSRYDQSLSLSRQEGVRLAEATALAKIGRLLGLKGEIKEARTKLEEALELYRQIGSKLGVENCLRWLVRIKEPEHDEG